MFKLFAEGPPLRSARRLDRALSGLVIYRLLRNYGRTPRVYVQAAAAEVACILLLDTLVS